MNQQTVVAQQNETVSHVCWRVYGKSSGMVEKVLAANPTLCELPATLPAGTVLTMPEAVTRAAKQNHAIVPTVNLWD